MKLFERKIAWRLTWPGKLLLFAITGLSAAAGLLTLHPFLATTRPVDADLLVVEGWVKEYAIEAAADEFRHGHYRQIVTTGGPVEGAGAYTNDHNTNAGVAAGRLRNAGISAHLIAPVPARLVSRDRTYAAAVALRQWFDAQPRTVTRINVLTEGPHARRTRLMYEKALGPRVTVGVIAVASPDYDPQRWWKYSEGVRSVVGETIAYLYARIFFLPTSTLPAPPPES